MRASGDFSKPEGAATLKSLAKTVRALVQSCAPDGDVGGLGPRGPQGPVGDSGPQGPTGARTGARGRDRWRCAPCGVLRRRRYLAACACVLVGHPVLPVLDLLVSTCV